MIKIIGNDILRAGEKAGYLEENKVYSHDGRKLGYFEGKEIYDHEDRKVAYIEENYIYAEGATKKTPLEKINEDIEGILSETGKCAIYILLGN